MTQDLQTRSWDNTNIYKGQWDPRIKEDFTSTEQIIAQLQSEIVPLKSEIPQLSTKTLSDLELHLPRLIGAYRHILDYEARLYTIRTFASCDISVNGHDYEAKNIMQKSMTLLTELTKLRKVLDLFLLRSPDGFLSKFLQDKQVSELRFYFEHAQKEKDFLLSPEEESLMETLSLDGFEAWSQLYSELASSIKVDFEGREIGLAEVSNYLFQGDPDKREKAYCALNKGWQKNEVSAAAILNSLNGWRWENYRLRSRKRELHYLDSSCHYQRISRATLGALMEATYEHRHVGHEALALMAKEMGKEKLDPWDITAPFPVRVTAQPTPYPEAIKTVINAFAEFSPEMADFAQYMHDHNWIDATPTENRGTGANCRSFKSPLEPRVFLTYDGSMKNIITLAHEIGHAYHTWVMRDLPLSETHYSSTLAETASTFAETLVRQALYKNAQSLEEKKAILWQEIESASTFLINIPARFEFEKQFMEHRRSKRLTVPEIKELSVQAWRSWYGETLTEYNEMYWAAKLHFSMSRVSFYNYPYLFGYLFSLGLYSQKDKYGDQFPKVYVSLLKDTGRMTAEDLVKKHFQQDISEKDFWINSLQVVEKFVNDYRDLQMTH